MTETGERLATLEAHYKHMSDDIKEIKESCQRMEESVFKVNIKIALLAAAAGVGGSSMMELLL